MSVDPDLAAHLHLLDGLTAADYGTADGARRIHAMWALFPPPELPPLTISEESAEGPHGPIRVRLYWPRDPADQSGGGLVWLHGGAWSGGDLDMPEADFVSRAVCARSGAVVVTVEYRRARDGVHFPVPHDDVVAAFQWVVQRAESLGVDPSRVSLGGASAGGNLAAGAALRLRDAGGPVPHALLLLYPVLHTELPPLRPALEAELPSLPALWHSSPELYHRIVTNYLGGPIEQASPYAFPALGDLRGLPPTLVLVCEYDSWSSTGEAFAEQLREAGVAVELYCEPGVPHAHVNYTGLRATARTIDVLARWLREPAPAASSQP